jgi:hypothetical protein
MSKRSQRSLYVGLDVSLKETSIAVIDDADKSVWRGTVASTPEMIAEALRKHASRAVRIGLEAGQLSSWLYHGLTAKSLPDRRSAGIGRPIPKLEVRPDLGLSRLAPALSLQRRPPAM